MALPSMISAAMARGIVARDAWDRRARRAVVPNGGGDEDEDDEDGREVNRRATSERAAVRHCPPEIFIIFREGRERRGRVRRRVRFKFDRLESSTQKNDESSRDERFDRETGAMNAWMNESLRCVLKRNKRRARVDETANGENGTENGSRSRREDVERGAHGAPASASALAFSAAIVSARNALASSETLYSYLPPPPLSTNSSVRSSVGVTPGPSSMCS